MSSIRGREKPSRKLTKYSEELSSTTRETKRSIGLKKRKQALEIEKRRQELEKESRPVQCELKEKKRQLEDDSKMLRIKSSCALEENTNGSNSESSREACTIFPNANLLENGKGDVNWEDLVLLLMKLSNAAGYVSIPNKYPKYEMEPFEHRKLGILYSTSETREDKLNYCDRKQHENRCPQMQADDLDGKWKVVTRKNFAFLVWERNTKNTSVDTLGHAAEMVVNYFTMNYHIRTYLPDRMNTTSA
ncbi:hypothetical protein JTB14_017608 [Gonioctena quinquepunctata]|nr:hypothetical protein JTB14_017608 [Gonioctena quinquepunctata]